MSWIERTGDNTYPEPHTATLLLLSNGVIIIGYWIPEHNKWDMMDNLYGGDLIDVNTTTIDYWQKLPEFPEGFKVK